MTMKHLVSICMVILSLTGGAGAQAQDFKQQLKAYEAAFKAHPPRKIPAPANLKSIALSSSGSAASEIWELDSSDGRTGRDVTQPALIPVVPTHGTANGSSMIIAPGGGFFSLSMDTEGLEVAK